MKKRTVLMPKYMKSFHCIGSECEDTCCYGWKIDINEEMYKKYKKVMKPDMKKMLDKYITRNRSNPSSETFAKIRMNDNGNCPFLCNDGLCELHKTLGEDYLSKVCMTYPRVFNVVNGILEKSVDFSCPEAVQVALLNPNLMEFDEIEEDSDIQNIISNILNTEDIKYKDKVQQYFWPIRIFTISLLQNRKYKLWERLIILGLFIDKLQGYSNEENISRVPNLIEDFNKIIEQGNIKEQLSSISSNFKIQMELMKELNDERFSFSITPNNKEYVHCVGEFLQGIEYTDGCNMEEVVKNYANAYANYYKHYMDKHEYILENYIVNYVFKELFPVASNAGVFDDYMQLIVHYSLIKMLLIGMSGYFKELNEKIVIRLIYSFSRSIDHNKTYLNKVFNLLRENNYNTMAYMAILIKN